MPSSSPPMIMTTMDSQNLQPQPVTLAPRTSRDHTAMMNGMNEASPMPYACKTCSARKVKCDRFTPRCSNCRKSDAGCVYEAPPPRKKRRPFRSAAGEGDVALREKVALYEQILGERGLLPIVRGEEGSPSTSTLATITTVGTMPIPRDGEGENGVDIKRLMYIEPELNEKGKLVGAENGGVRFMGSRIWESLEEQGSFEEEAEEGEDVLSSAFVDVKRDLRELHPCREDVLFLWKTHLERVEPICKVLHIPSMTPIIEAATQTPDQISKTTEPLLFAIYHFAVLSLKEEECTRNLLTPLSRSTLLHNLSLATRQSLTNISFLQTTSFTVLQALTLHLLSTKYSTPPQTFWILTGSAIRLAQQLGLHRDGTKLSLPPFETQMRRRIWYQLLPLDLWAGQVAGTGIATLPESWDTEAPWNVDDGDIWPGMREVPKETKGAGEMMFCLVRATLGRAFGAAKLQTGGVEAVIRKAEEEVEERFLRYADVVDPVHFLTGCLARSGIAAMRLRWLLGCLERDLGVMSLEWKREILFLTQKIVDTDSAAVENGALQRLFGWYIGGVFIWGSWESLIFNLQMLRKRELGGAETEDAWRRIEKMVGNHPEEILRSKKRLLVAIRRLMMRAWDASPLVGGKEPQFLSSLLRQERKSIVSSPPTISEIASDSYASTAGSAATTLPPADSYPSNNNYMGLQDFDLDGKDQGLDLDENFDLGAVDWSFWNQLIQDVQKGG